MDVQKILEDNNGIGILLQIFICVAGELDNFRKFGWRGATTIRNLPLLKRTIIRTCIF